MKYILILSSLVVAIVARPQTQFAPQTQQRQQPRNGNGRAIQSTRVRDSVNNLNNQGESNLPDGPKIYKYVTIHVAPTEAPAVITPQVSSSSGSPKKIPDAHYQIIFIKAPTSPQSVGPTEVELPAEPERRTLVYVLVKQPEAGDNKIKIRPTANKPPSPPEVFFIRYKDRNEGSGNNDSVDDDRQQIRGSSKFDDDDINQQRIK